MPERERSHVWEFNGVMLGASNCRVLGSNAVPAAGPPPTELHPQGRPTGLCSNFYVFECAPTVAGVRRMKVVRPAGFEPADDTAFEAAGYAVLLRAELGGGRRNRTTWFYPPLRLERSCEPFRGVLRLAAGQGLEP